jgi:hypothetical protein
VIPRVWSDRYRVKTDVFNPARFVILDMEWWAPCTLGDGRELSWSAYEDAENWLIFCARAWSSGRVPAPVGGRSWRLYPWEAPPTWDE